MKPFFVFAFLLPPELTSKCRVTIHFPSTTLMDFPGRVRRSETSGRPEAPPRGNSHHHTCAVQCGGEESCFWTCEPCRVHTGSRPVASNKSPLNPLRAPKHRAIRPMRRSHLFDLGKASADPGNLLVDVSYTVSRGTGDT